MWLRRIRSVANPTPQSKNAQLTLEAMRWPDTKCRVRGVTEGHEKRVVSALVVSS